MRLWVKGLLGVGGLVALFGIGLIIYDALTEPTTVVPLPMPPREPQTMPEVQVVGISNEMAGFGLLLVGLAVIAIAALAHRATERR